MSRKAAIAVIVVIGVAAGGFWWLHRSKDAAPSPSASAPVQKTATPRAERRVADDEAAPPVLVDDDPRGALRLEGLVEDSEGHPVGGASVVLGSNPPRTAKTEADGSFAFDALVGRPYSLVARAAQGIAGPITAREPFWYV